MGFYDRRETADQFEYQLGVNYIGHFLLTTLLLDLLKSTKYSRVVSVSSIIHHIASQMDFDDLQSHKSYGPLATYAKSKLAIAMFIQELS